MVMCIVKKASEELLKIGLPGTAGQLVDYVTILEERARMVPQGSRENWRYTFAGQVLAASISCDRHGDKALFSVQMADMLLAELERAKGSTGRQAVAK